MAKVGSPRAELSRSDLGRAIAESLAVVIAFTVWVVVSKESRSIELTLPWQDDPFDILTSFDFVLPPVLVAVIACRSILLASPGPVPLRRGVDLLRACGVAIGVCAITELGYWMAVLFGLHRAEWHAATA